MVDLALPMAVGLLPAVAALRLLDRIVRRRAAAGRAALSPAAETALHWLICLTAMAALFGLGAVLAP